MCRIYTENRVFAESSGRPYHDRSIPCIVASGGAESRSNERIMSRSSTRKRRVALPICSLSPPAVRRDDGRSLRMSGSRAGSTILPTATAGLAAKKVPTSTGRAASLQPARTAAAPAAIRSLLMMCRIRCIGVASGFRINLARSVQTPRCGHLRKSKTAFLGFESHSPGSIPTRPWS